MEFSADHKTDPFLTIRASKNKIANIIPSMTLSLVGPELPEHSGFFNRRISPSMAKRLTESLGIKVERLS